MSQEGYSLVDIYERRGYIYLVLFIPVPSVLTIHIEEREILKYSPHLL